MTVLSLFIIITMIGGFILPLLATHKFHDGRTKPNQKLVEHNQRTKMKFVSILVGVFSFGISGTLTIAFGIESILWLLLIATISGILIAVSVSKIMMAYCRKRNIEMFEVKDISYKEKSAIAIRMSNINTKKENHIFEEEFEEAHCSDAAPYIAINQ